MARANDAAAAVAVLSEPAAIEDEHGAAAEAPLLDEILEQAHVAAPAPQPVAAAPLRTARVLSVDGRTARVAYRGRTEGVAAQIEEGVDRELVARALAGNEAVLVEADPELGPIIVGVIQTRLPDALELKARKVVLEADEELLLRSGRGALRIREDGDVELVGSRISALSRGLFRIVGRVLRLN
jgi:hypothetical protein